MQQQLYHEPAWLTGQLLALAALSCARWHLRHSDPVTGKSQRIQLNKMKRCLLDNLCRLEQKRKGNLRIKHEKKFGRVPVVLLKPMWRAVVGSMSDAFHKKLLWWNSLKPGNPRRRIESKVPDLKWLSSVAFSVLTHKRSHSFAVRAIRSGEEPKQKRL